MDIPASLITILSSALSLALSVKNLIQSIREQDEIAKELENKIVTLTTVLVDVGKAYGTEKGQSYSPSDQELRQCVQEVVLHCNKDLKKFEENLPKLLCHSNWVSVAWRQQVAAPELLRIDKSVSERLQSLSMLVQLLQGRRLDQIYRILQTLIDKSTTDTSSSATNGNSTADADSMVLQVTDLIRKQELGSPEKHEPSANGSLNEENEIESQESPEDIANRESLFRAILDGNNDLFESLLEVLKGELKFKHKDGRDPLLLAAHLGNADMVQRLLTDEAVPNGSSTNITPSAAPGTDNHEDHTNTISRRGFDLNATDKLGRTALHYCAEFGMRDAAEILLDHGVGVNARDNGNFPPAYFAAKKRKAVAMELLLARGARTDFMRPTTSDEIEKLLDRHHNNDP